MRRRMLHLGRERVIDRTRVCALVALMLTSVAGCGGGRVSSELRRELPWVRDVEFVGNEAFDDGRLEGMMSLKEPSLFHPLRRTYYFRDLLTKDLAIVQDFYRDRGYLDMRVVSVDEDFSDDRSTVALTITVEEGDVTRVGAIAFEGVTVLHEEELSDLVELEPGKRFSPFVGRGDVERIRYAYFDRGYFNAQIEMTVSESDVGLRVRFRVTEGIPSRLRYVTARTNGSTLTRHITREVTTKAGEVVKRGDLLEAQKRLTELGLFTMVRPRMVPVDSTGLVDVVIEVRERKHGFYGFGFGFSSDERVRLSGEWGHRNVFGTARRIRTSGSLGWEVDSLLTESADKSLAERELTVTWVEPWLFGTRTEGSFAVFHEFEHLPRSFEYTTNGIRATFRRRLTRVIDLFLTLENEWRSSNDTTFAKEDFVSRSLRVEVERDTRDNILDPRRGSRQSGTVEYAGLEGDHNFLKTTLTTSHAIRPWRQGSSLFAFRLQGGIVVPAGSDDRDRLARVPSQDRFFIGGATSLRGYRREEVGPLGADGITQGGTVLLLAGAEFRFPIVWRFRGGVFVDAGNIWADPREIKPGRFVGEFGTTYSPLDVRYSAGGGIRLTTPVGPLRVDYAHKLGTATDHVFDRDWEVHFSLGHAF